MRAVLMSMPNCDTQPNQRQYASVFAGICTPTYRYPMDMRPLLKALMALRDENAYGLESRSGVPQATINRFLTGKHGDPRPPTVRKLAGAYGLTESQLRGDAPLPESLARQIDRLATDRADGKHVGRCDDCGSCHGLASQNLPSLPHIPISRAVMRPGSRSNLVNLHPVLISLPFRGSIRVLTLLAHESSAAHLSMLCLQFAQSFMAWSPVLLDPVRAPIQATWRAVAPKS